MTNAQMTEMRRRLSTAAVRMLIDFTPRQGATLSASTKAEEATLAELGAAGMIGPDRGLTRAGEIVRGREMERMLDEMF